MTVSVHLVRHGEVFNPDKVLYGRLPGFGLSSLGLQMAQELADGWQETPTMLVTSPLQRAQETITPLAKKFQLPVRTDKRVLEAGNSFEGLSNMRRQLRNPKYWPRVLNPWRPSWGEPYVHQAARMAAAIQDLRDDLMRNYGSGASAVVVSHQLPIWVTRLSAEDKPLAHDPRRRQCSLASVTSFEFAPGHRKPTVHYSEPVKHLSNQAAALPGA
ncbi:histidine phosphatase family protein [Yaniella flava]|uniref:Histidine phosphatase family protein n=1 Tax=Yaniella flava TaxID=287930 RepID=A0ABP5G710_9MICC